MSIEETGSVPGRHGAVWKLVRRFTRGREVQKTAINLVALGLLSLWIGLQSSVFFTSANLWNVLNQMAVIGIIGSALTLLMVAGQFDISVGGVLALSGVVAALLVEAGTPIPVAFLAAVGVGALVGLANSLLVVFIGITSVIATIGTMYMTRGIAEVITGGTPVSNVPLSFSTLGAGFVYGRITYPILIMALIVVALTVVQQSTVFGQHTVASGSNAQAAFRSGVPVRRTQTICFVLVGAASGLGGAIYASRVGAGVPDIAVGLEFDVIVAAVLGGTALFGGEGRVLGTFLGALLIATMNNGLDLLRIDPFWQQVLVGVVLVLAIVVDIVLRRDLSGISRRLVSGVLRGGAKSLEYRQKR